VNVHSEHSIFVPVVPTCQRCNQAALSLSAPQPIHVTSEQNSSTASELSSYFLPQYMNISMNPHLMHPNPFQNLPTFTKLPDRVI